MNAITIQQSAKEMALAAEVNRNAAICAVRLSHSRMTSRALDEPPKGRIQVRFTVKSRPVDGPKGKLRVRVDFRMMGELEPQQAPEGRAKKERIVSVECSYAVDYQLREGFEPSIKQIKAFKDGNVIFNSWPYFREYLQESIQRMGFPPLTAPFLRVQTKSPRAAQKEGPEETEKTETK
jgi:hypothetical protein